MEKKPRRVEKYKMKHSFDFFVSTKYLVMMSYCFKKSNVNEKCQVIGKSVVRQVSKIGGCQCLLMSICTIKKVSGELSLHFYLEEASSFVFRVKYERLDDMSRPPFCSETNIFNLFKELRL